MGHLFFGNALHDPWLRFLNTHPPLVKRVRLLDPQFDGNFPFIKSWSARVRAGETSIETLAMPKALPNANEERRREVRLAALLNPVSSRAMPLKYAAGLNASFPDELAMAAREPFGACALVYAILLNADQEARAKQITEITAVLDEALLRETQKLFPSVATLTNGQKLALINLTFPSLRQLTAEQFAQFSKTLQMLVESDEQVSLFEFALQKMLFRNLPRFAPARRGIIQFYALPPVFSDCEVLFSALARVGSKDDKQVEEAFALGATQLKIPGDKARLLPIEQCGVEQIDIALNHLAQAAIPVKNQVLRACACVVANDGVVEETEAELLRAIAAALDCPLPPLVGEIESERKSTE
jgi:uncharacterized tellurite resistance protein B-like protein